MNNKRLLLIEDNEADIYLVDESLKMVDETFRPQLFSLTDGDKAIQFLSGIVQRTNRDVPDVILLDINLPRHSGFEVLKYIRSESALKHIPVIMMSTSQTRNDINNCFKYGCNSYIVKPIDFDEFNHVIFCFCNFWFKTSVLPFIEP